MLLIVSFAFAPLLFASFTPLGQKRSPPIVPASTHKMVSVDLPAYSTHEEVPWRTEISPTMTPDSLQNPIENRPRSILKRRLHIDAPVMNKRESFRLKRHKSGRCFEPNAFQGAGQIMTLEDKIFMFPRNNSMFFSLPKFEEVDLAVFLPEPRLEK